MTRVILHVIDHVIDHVIVHVIVHVILYVIVYVILHVTIITTRNQLCLYLIILLLAPINKYYYINRTWNIHLDPIK